MTFEYLHQGAKHWQTLIGNLIGFLGVVTTLTYNAKANRKAEERRWHSDRQAEQARLQRDQVSLRRALSVEILYEQKLARDALKTISPRSDGNKAHETYIVQLNFNTGLYARMRPEVTILSKEEQVELANLSSRNADATRKLRLAGRSHKSDDTIVDGVVELSDGEGCAAARASIASLAIACERAFDIISTELGKDKIDPLSLTDP